MSTYGEFIEGSDQPRQYTVRDTRRNVAWRRFWTWTWRIALVIAVLLIALFIRFIPESFNPFAASQTQGNSAQLPAGEQPPAGAAGSATTSTPVPSGGQSPSSARTQLIAVPGDRGPAGVDGAPGRDGAPGSPGADGAAGADGGINDGQGDSAVMACDDSIGVSLRSAWNSGRFTLDRLILTGVSDACEGSYFHLILLDHDGAPLADIEVPSIHVESRQSVISAQDYPVFTGIESTSLARVVMEIAS